VNGQGINTAEVAVVVSNDLVRFQIPAFDHLVVSAREQVWVTW